MPQTPSCKIAILAKAPVAGYCKTRLIPHLGAKGAARLQGRLIIRTIETALAADIGPVSLWCTPDPHHWMFTKLRMTYGVCLERQTRGDLGHRMLMAIRQGLKSHETVIVLGTDCPALTPESIRLAHEQLLDVEHVFQPATDGGYVLVGSRRYMPAMFRNIPWGESSVMSLTQRRLQAQQTNWRLRQPLWDVDEIGDLRRAQAQGLL